MILYIHGFGSSAEAKKAKLFREFFKSSGEPFIAPSLSHIPNLALSTLEDIIEACESDVKIIGASLGGFYSLYLSQKYNLKAVLINPSINPEITLQRAIGHGMSYYDNSQYEWNATHVESLKKFKTSSVNQKNIMLLLQKGDDLLDYKEAELFLQGSTMFIEEGGTHNFEGIERYFEKIEVFLI